jgi:hypothetical protein
MIRVHLAVACCVAMLVAPVWAQQPAQPVDAAAGKSLAKLSADVAKAKRRFFVLYNRLNEDESYAVSCDTSASTGTRLAKQTCRSNAEIDATEQQTSDVIYAMLDAQTAMNQTTLDSGRAGNGVTTEQATSDSTQAQLSAGQADIAASKVKATAMQAEVAAANSNDKLTQHILDLVNRYPELRKLYDEHAAAVQRYQNALQAR